MPTYVVAGASRGLGLEFVNQLLARGETVVGLVRNKQTATGLTSISNPKLHVVVGDITDAASLAKAAEETGKLTNGAIDVLINNAAYQDHAHNWHDITAYPSQAELVTDLTTTFETNVLGPVLTTNAFLPLLKKGGLKKVITLNTGLADVQFNLESGWDGQTAYCVTKNALDMAIVKFANALKGDGFTFLSISPGVVATANEVPPPHVLAGIQRMAGQFAKVAPHFAGPITPPESVAFMLPIIDKWSVEDSGKFVSHLGNRQWL